MRYKYTDEGKIIKLLNEIRNQANDASPDKKEINHKNSKYCTDPNECYQTIACRGGNKKLCKYFDMSVK